MTEFYRCACGFADTMDNVIKHVSHKINVEKDTRYYADGGHAIMLREKREQAEQERAKHA